MKRLLDRADERILMELTRNARISHADLAARVNLSRNAVRQRIERLERDGLIRGYTIVAGEGRIATSTIAALMFVYRNDRMRGADVIQALRRIPEVVACDVMSGEFDLVVRVEATEADRTRQIWQEISALPGVRDTLTAFALSSMIRR
ncbi:Lrp/AsnC family transcriptional regulator [Mesorhizobium sp. M1A.F.Ca.IN.022.07.1.1]|uniref:Lrp/AsnC family transcriptional regulator n=1 Tax=unclassified Mesorhizobium TaxID=325217 RepID=UPI000FC9F0AE|nr:MULTISPECIES: Lrp/AsnC family transcriptional regulator [unclassified Mesorhizobium]TGV91857.1 Lrp/AsnC family transcriptional regulator [Mesorhizobium sp. M00.F.Ca.ET.158.01.1.1]MCT2578824.1 Lrp/AsnC family transcriptional regulator [Mesorhizobium sp. P13.3]MDF3167763.1 Lrp/AsnC family transcriptional regulator [Mesorhizobium sp. P16.1]MDF3178352.1 Lrp/AsnC family transcriptional regulator [Mesorhizobium sp. P17.1]MDF3184676.1 Lrp/AsnC family transcriptional regulator [Mesorhizobium sp. IC